jgi:hypothetical protein
MEALKTVSSAHGYTSRTTSYLTSNFHLCSGKVPYVFVPAVELRSLQLIVSIATRVPRLPVHTIMTRTVVPIENIIAVIMR